MAAPQDISRAGALITDLLDTAWTSAAPERPLPYEQFFHVGEFGRGEHTDFRHHGVSRFVERDEYEDIDYDELKFGEKFTNTYRNWGRGLMVSEEFLRDIADAGVKDGYNVARIGSYIETVKEWRVMVDLQVDQECWDLLIYGTGTTLFTGRDGLALFSASHVTFEGTTQTNIDTGGVLSATRVAAMRKMLDTQLDDRDEFIRTSGPYQLAHGPDLKDRAYELVRTKGKVDSANNNVNVLDQYDIEPVEVYALGASYAGYFMGKKKAHKLYWKWRFKPEFKKEASFDNVAQKYRGLYAGNRWAADWRGIVANAGS